MLTPRPGHQEGQTPRAEADEEEDEENIGIGLRKTCDHIVNFTDSMPMIQVNDETPLIRRNK